MHFKWTNVVCLSIDMLIFSMMDVVIISAKLVCSLFSLQIELFVWYYNTPAILYYRLQVLKTTPKFDLVLLDAAATAIVVHPEWNLIFFIGGKEPSSHITWTAEKFISSLPLPFGMVDVASCQRSSSADINSRLA